jgi:hypothetical protein
VLLAAALMLAAAPVSANSWRKHDGNHSKHYSKQHDGQSHYKAKHHRKHYKKHHGKHYSKKHHRRHHGHGGYGHGSYVTRHAYGYPVHHYGYDSGAYYCGPCRHYFDSYDHLSHHVHGHHGVAVLALPSVILQASIGGGIGWVFGY